MVLLFHHNQCTMPCKDRTSNLIAVYSLGDYCSFIVLAGIILEYLSRQHQRKSIVTTVSIQQIYHWSLMMFSWMIPVISITVYWQWLILIQTACRIPTIITIHWKKITYPLLFLVSKIWWLDLSSISKININNYLCANFQLLVLTWSMPSSMISKGQGSLT